jgi:hypothetical protein
MKIIITSKEYSEMLTLERFKRTSPCIGCNYKTPMCGNECSNLWEWEEQLSKCKTESTEKLSQVPDIMTFVKLTVDLEDLEAEIQKLNIKFSELSKQRSVLKGTKEINIVSE